MNIVLYKKTDIRITTKKPEKFCDDSFPVDLLGCEKWETFFEFKPELTTKETIGHISTSEIFVVDTMFDEVSTEVKILLFWMKRHRKNIMSFLRMQES